MSVFSPPNLLTWGRIALIPLFVVVFYFPFDWARPASAWLFALAGITDWLDGYLARRMNLTSKFGAFLDPVADKLIVAVALVIIVEADTSAFQVAVAIASAIIIGREITISALREWLAEIGARAHVDVSFTAKVKTTMQITAIILLLYREPLFGLPTYSIGIACLFAAAALTLWTMTRYIIAAAPFLTEEAEPGQ